MNTLQNIRVEFSISPSTKNAAAFVDNQIDTNGFNYAAFIFKLGLTDADITVMKLQHSDDNSTWVDLPGAIFGTSTAPAYDGGAVVALPLSTDDFKTYAVYIDLAKAKRWITAKATAASGTVGATLTCICLLSRAVESPFDKLTRYVDGELVV